MPKGKPYQIDERAWQEVEAASDWYGERSEDARITFLLEVIQSFETISAAPRRWPKYLHGTRRYLLPHFPFSVVYLDDPNGVTIVAEPIASGSRGTGGDGCEPKAMNFPLIAKNAMSGAPGRWRGRLRVRNPGLENREHGAPD